MSKEKLELNGESSADLLAERNIADCVRVKAQAESEVVKIGEANASATLVVGSAQGHVMKLEAAAWRKFGDAALVQKIVDTLPALAEEMGKPLASTTEESSFPTANLREVKTWRSTTSTMEAERSLNERSSSTSPTRCGSRVTCKRKDFLFSRKMFVTTRMQAALVGIGILLFCTVTFGSALDLELYHDFGFEDISTGVTVCSEDRVFVSFPRWFKAGRAANPSVALLDGKGQMQAFPRSGSFAQPWEEGVPRENHFVNIQSIFCDHKDRLFVLDTGTPFLGASEGAKLILFSPDGELQRVFPFDKDVAPETSYLNDVRVTREGNHAILTDSNLGGLVVLDLETGESWKVLADHPSTHAEDIVAKVEGQEVRLGTGDPAKFQSDGLAVLGDYLFYCAMTSRTLYRIPVKRLVDRESTDDVLSALVERVSSTNMPDGIVAASDEKLSHGVIFMTGVEGSSIDYIDAVKGTREESHLG